jgi:predicted dehydrogenase
MKQALIIGYGSIGRRHANILSELGLEVALLTKQSVKEYKVYRNIKEALQEMRPGYIVIANPTHLHHFTLTELFQLGYSGLLLVEKPLFSVVETCDAYLADQAFVAYNLRFNELLVKAKAFLKNETLISFSANVGQYLPEWRENVDYRVSYSASTKCGGGVLRDLSHELDYALWFCEACVEVSAVGGKYSELDIQSDDVYSIIMRCKNCPIVSIQMDYLSRAPKRCIAIQTKKHSMTIDLLKGQLFIDGRLQYDRPNAMETSYLKQHKALLSGDFSHFCTYEKGLNVVKLIEAIESSNEKRSWVSL